MKSFELKGTARQIAERSSEQSRALKAIRKNGGVPCVLYGGKENANFTVSGKGSPEAGLHTSYLCCRSCSSMERRRMPY
jgi:hypothetical protein